MGNVLSRSSATEDPWISISGTHASGVSNGLIVWGENNWPGGSSTNGHLTLKNNNDGVNVYVSVQPVPLPAPAFLLLGGLGGIAALRRRKTA